ncbi:MAG: hypothetical protein AAGB51_03625 [Planctomycetota bacterium]
MSSSNAFNQVKGILGKLDRSIDQARERRLGTTPGSAAAPQAPEADPAQRVGADETSANTEINQNEQAGSKRYGRAKPIRPTGDVGFRF